MALLVCVGFEHVPDAQSRLMRPIDIWWVVHDGGLQLLLTTILRKAKVWAQSALRVFCVVQAAEDASELHGKVTDFLYKMRIDAVVQCVVLSEGYDAAAFNRHREAAAAWRMRKNVVSSLAAGLSGGTGVTYDNVDQPRDMYNTAPDLAATDGTPDSPSRNSLSARRKRKQATSFTDAAKAEAAKAEKTKSIALAELFSAEEMRSVRKLSTPLVPIDTTGDGKSDSWAIDTTMDGKVDTVVGGHTKHVHVDTTGDGVADHLGVDTTRDGLVDTLVPIPHAAAPPKQRPGTHRGTHPATQPADEAAADADLAWEQTFLSTRVLNKLMLKYSSSASLVMTNLPTPGKESLAHPTRYMEQVDMLTSGLLLVMLVAGVDDYETITLEQ